MLKKIYLTLTFFSGLLLCAQEQVNDDVVYPGSEQTDSIATPVHNFRLGVKLGIPNIAGANAEFILPILNNHWGVYADLSGFSIKPEETIRTTPNYREYGLNYYLGTQGNGLYFSVGAGQLQTELDFEDVALDNGQTGRGRAEVNLSTQNLKLGVKSKGRLYFRFELGYGLGSMPESVTFVATTSSGGQQSTTEDIPELPGVNQNGIIIGNFGFGISF